MVKVILSNPPDHYEAEAEYRLTKSGDKCLAIDGSVYQTYCDDQRAIVLTPKKKWRQPRMPEDWGKRCRVRNACEEWREGTLRGYRPGNAYPWVLDTATFKHCEVEDT